MSGSQWPENIQELSANRVPVLRHLNGAVRLEEVDPIFNRLRPGAPGSEFADFDTPLGPIRLCLGEVFRQLWIHAFTCGKPHVAQCDSGTQLSRRTGELFRRASEARMVPGRKRALYTKHSTRVAAVSYLLKAGLAETIISVLCNWSSDQVRRYGRRLVLDPAVVGHWPFYNPDSIAGAYAGGLRAGGRKRKRPRGW